MTSMFSSIDALFFSIVESESVESIFQPIVSVKKKSIVGFESFFNGIHPQTRSKIPVKIPFSSSDSELNTQMDQLCRRKGIESYAGLPFPLRNTFLSLDYDHSMIINGLIGLEQFMQHLSFNGIRSNQISIKFMESAGKNISALCDQVSLFREYGFMIALDRVGSASTSLDSIVQIKADIVKISKTLLRDLDKESYKQEIVSSLITLSHRAGSVVIADGVDNEAQVITCMELGVDFLQGKYFGKPSMLSQDELVFVNSQMKEMSSKIRNKKVSRIIKEEAQKQGIENVVDSCIESLCELSPDWFEGEMEQLVLKNQAMECLYMLNEDGIQITDTVCSDKIRKKNSMLFSPAPKGTDQSMKDYFLSINSSRNVYITEPYVSLASGNQCITISKVFSSDDGNRYILCVDVYPDVV